MTKEFKSIDEQINILTSRGLLFEDQEKAKINLMRYGYYEIINGYKNPLLKEEKTDNSEEVYRDDSTFEHIFSLYKMDKGLQESVRNSSMTFEQIVKTALAYHISEKYGHDDKIYLNKKYYNSGKIDQYGKSQLYYLMKKFNKIRNDNLQPYKHYREDHGHIPAWILLKGASLGNIKIFYKLQKNDIKTKVIETVLGIPPILKTNTYPDYIYNYFTSILNISQAFRNIASHGGRIYNYKANYIHTPYIDSIHNEIGISKNQFKRKKLGVNDLYTLVYFYKLLDDITPFIQLSVGIRYFLKKHLEIYPEDKDYVLEQMGVPFEIRDKSIDDIF